MASAVLTGPARDNVSGHHRVKTYESIRFHNHNDTWVVHGMRTIFQIALTPTEDEPFGFTVDGNKLTLKSEGGLTFRGSIYGL